MSQKEEIFQYLEQYRGKGNADSVILRAGNALVRYNVTTIAAAGLTDGKIARMRGVGEKTKSFIRQAIEDYQKDQAQISGCLGILPVGVEDYQKEQG